MHTFAEDIVIDALAKQPTASLQHLTQFALKATIRQMLADLSSLSDDLNSVPENYAKAAVFWALELLCRFGTAHIPDRIINVTGVRGELRKQRGWVIQHAERYAAATDTGFEWTDELAAAIWCVDRVSAEQLAAILGDDATAVVERELVRSPSHIDPDFPPT